MTDAAPEQTTPDGGQAPAPRPFDGLPPVEHLGRALRAASEAGAPESAGRFLILTHRGPDPDALGACEGLRLLIERGFAFRCVVATHGRVHRAENVALLRTLELDLEDYATVDPTAFCGTLIVDTQPAFAHTVVPDEPPVVAVFDHHRSPQSGKGTASVPHVDVRTELGSTSSILYEYLRDMDVPLDATTASALFCGIRYDTADLSRNASPLDEEAFLATFRAGDRQRIAAIDRPPLPKSYYRHIAQGLGEARQHGPLVLALMGRVENPEHVAEMADFFLRMKGCSWVVAGGAFEDEYVVSLRTDYAFGKAYSLMERVVGDDASFGGHGHIAGGRIRLEDSGMSTIKSVERKLRKNALAVIATSDGDDSQAPDGKRLDE
ncbi:MAG: DHH family phosphoesterase [Planctomycetota bacterium]